MRRGDRHRRGRAGTPRGRAGRDDEFGGHHRVAPAVGVIMWLAPELSYRRPVRGLLRAPRRERPGCRRAPIFDMAPALLDGAPAHVERHDAPLGGAAERGDLASGRGPLARGHPGARHALPRQPALGGPASASPSAPTYGSIYHLITGFTGLHVLGGLVPMVAVAGLVLRRDSGRRSARRWRSRATYWHFVDPVWIFVFATIYPR